MTASDIKNSILRECTDGTTTLDNNKRTRILSLLSDYRVAVLEEYTLDDTGMGYLTTSKKWEDN